LISLIYQIAELSSICKIRFYGAIGCNSVSGQL